MAEKGGWQWQCDRTPPLYFPSRLGFPFERLFFTTSPSPRACLIISILRFRPAVRRPGFFIRFAAAA